MYYAFSFNTKFDAVLYHYSFITNLQSVCVLNIADSNLPHNLRVLSEALSSRKIRNDCAVEFSGGFTKQQKKTVNASGNYPLIYTERISINICILKIKY